MINKRTQSSRYFIKSGTNGQTFYVQQSAGNLHYADNSGNLITLDTRLRPNPMQPNTYTAQHQPLPTTLNMNNGNSSINLGPFELVFNHNSKLYFVTQTEETQLYNSININNSTVGSDGAYTTDAWAQIDRSVVFTDGQIKTNFIIKSPLTLPSVNGWLAFEDEIVLPDGYTIVRDTVGKLTPSGYWKGDLIIINTFTQTEVARWHLGYAYDNSGNNSKGIKILYDVKQMGATYYIRSMVRANWLTDNSTVYPVTVDPLVSGTNTWSTGLIGFTSYAPGDGNCGNSSAWCLGGPLNVTFPGQATITNVVWGLTYTASWPVNKNDGGFRLVGPCGEDPVNPDWWWSCNGMPYAPGQCIGSNISSPALATCLAPSCLPSVIPFSLKNIVCAYSGSACDVSFLSTDNNTWTMTVQGQTVAQPLAPTSSSGTTICLGGSTTLTATGQYGVPGYTYLWSPGGATTQSITVSPIVNTTYVCTITDVCGNTATNSILITVNTINTLTPIPVFTYSMVPIGGTPCPVTVTVNTCVAGSNNYGGGSEAYNWSFFGGTVTAGGATSGSVAGPGYGGVGACPNKTYTIVYNTGGTYTLSVQIIKGGQCATSNNIINICPVLPIELLSFTAKNIQNKKVQLDWITSSELNNDYFTLERSKDGMEYTGITTIKGAGNSNDQRFYTYMDESPFQGVSYYRLKQTDFDGTTSEAGISTVNIMDNSATISYFPNPFTGELVVEFSNISCSQAELSIVDMIGNRVFEKLLDNLSDTHNKFIFDLSEFSSGIYFAHFKTNDFIKVSKIVKK